MADVEVFVDDAVRGRLPNVCVKTGRPADGKLRVEKAFGGARGLWPLLVLGPIGVAILVYVAIFGMRREELTLRLPYSETVVDREIGVRRTRLAGTVTFAVLLLMVLAGRGASWVPVPLVAAVIAPLDQLPHPPSERSGASLRTPGLRRSDPRVRCRTVHLMRPPGLR